MVQYPIAFDVSLKATSGMQAIWTSFSAEHEVYCAIPKEFEGPGGAFSPEDLFAQSLLNCFTATFQVIAEKSQVSFAKLAATGRLTVDRDDSRKPVMKSFHLDIFLYGASHKERATGLVKKAIESGFILNSVKTSISYDLTFNE